MRTSDTKISSALRLAERRRARAAERFGRVAYVTAGDYRSLPTLHALGPEPLSDAFSRGSTKDRKVSDKLDKLRARIDGGGRAWTASSIVA